MLNLLPEKQKKIVVTQYWLRVSITVLFSLIIVLLIAIAFLAPTFIYSKDRTVQLEEQSLILENEARESGRIELSEDLKRWQMLVKLLDASVEKINIAETESIIKEKQTLSISIDGLEFYRRENDDKEVSEIKISGIAKDRQSLFEFQNRLKEVEVFESVELPVSNFAANINIDFMLTVQFKDKI